MKHLLRYTLFLMTALLPVLAMAQVDPKIQVNKYVTENADGTYTLDLETYATGWTKQTMAYVATDFVLVLDRSGSMLTKIPDYNKRVAAGKTLDYNKTYQIVIGGRTYCLVYGNRGSSKDPDYGWWLIIGAYSVNNQLGKFDDTRDYVVQSADEIYEETTTTRLAALKTAVNQFLDLVVKNNPPAGEKQHRVSVVWYAGSSSGGPGGGPTKKVADYIGEGTGHIYSDDSDAYFEMKELVTGTPGTGQETLSTYKSKISAVDNNGYDDNGDGTKSFPNIGGATFCEYGFQVAYNTLMHAKGDGRNKVVIFFTDGEPGSRGGYFYVPSARDAAYYAAEIKSSTDLQNKVKGESGNYKTFNPLIYSIGIMDDKTSLYHATESLTHQGDPVTADKYRFMHFLSSNYNKSSSEFTGSLDAFASSSTDGTEDPHDYFMRSDGSDLSSAFAKIAQREVKDRNEDLGTTTVIKDAMTDDFKLPDGATAADIKLYTCAIKTDNKTADTVWCATGTAVTGAVTVYKNAANKKVPSSVTGGHTEYWVPLTTVTPTISGKQVQVTDYDFKEKFVGVKRDFTDNDLNNIIGWTGEKFIMEFVIERDPASSGAKNQMNTNTANSGVYLSGTATDPLLKYPVPKVPVPNIIITKKGLAKGESAVFEVERVTSSAGTTPDATNVFKNTFILTKTNDAIDPSIEFVASGPGFYKVTEKTWTWNDNVTYDSGTDGTPDTDGNSYVQELTNTDTKKTFTFGVKTGPSKTTIKPKHNAEANINNGKES